MRIKSSLQPLVFSFSNVTALISAIARIYDCKRNIAASLCLYQEVYYLAVYANIRTRREVYNKVTEYGRFLGPGSIKYAHFEEYGLPISKNAISELGTALSRKTQ